MPIPQPHEYELDLGRCMSEPTTVAAVYGYKSTEWGDPIFKITRIILSNGISLNVEGEHDLPYIPYNVRICLPDDEPEDE